MKPLLALLIAMLLSVPSSAQTEDFENLIWLTSANLESVSKIVLERVRSFDEKFRNAYSEPLTDNTNRVVVRSTPFTDSDGVSYQSEIFVTVSDGEAVLTFLNLGGDLPDFSGATLTSRLYRAVVAAMDANYKRRPADN
jgi:hypothetical protein